MIEILDDKDDLVCQKFDSCYWIVCANLVEEFVEIDAEQMCHAIGTKSWTCVIICTHKDGNNPSLVSAWQGTHALVNVVVEQIQ